MAQAASHQQTRTKKGSTVAYLIVTLLVLCVVALLPFALTSVAGDVSDQSATLHEISEAAEDQPVLADVHLQIIGINEWEGTASIRVAAHQSCERACPWGDRYLFTSVYGDTTGKDDDRPATEVVTLPATARDVTQVIRLPIFGDPIRYPFDTYRLALGIVVDRLLPDGSTQTLTAEEARRYLTVSLQGRVPRATMSRPMAIDPTTLEHPGNDEPYLTVQAVTFGRPLYMKVLTVLLVLLVSAAAAYAVFLRPLNELIIGSGGLILGVWGIRGILLGTPFPGVTAVDVALTIVILFLLATITVRMAWLLEEQSAVKPIRGRLAGGSAANGTAPIKRVDYVPGLDPMVPTPGPVTSGHLAGDHEP